MYLAHSSSAVCRRQIRTQQVGAFARFPPGHTIFLHLPEQTHALGGLAQLYVIEIVHLRMPRLNLPQTPLHFVAVLQPPRGDGLL
jgi:hypothetical protein